MTAPTKPADSIPTEGNELARYLVNFYRYKMSTAQEAVKAHEAPDELPETQQHRA